MSLVFVGQHTNFHHQHFKMVDMLIHHYEQTKWSLNPCATPYIPKEPKETEINNNNKGDERRVETDASENTNYVKSNNDLIDSNDYDKWTKVGRIFRPVYKNDQNLNDVKVKSNNENRHELLNDLETQCYSNENKIEKTKDHKNKPKIIKSNPHHVYDVETSLLNKTIETFVERDNDNNEEELHEEL